MPIEIPDQLFKTVIQGEYGSGERWRERVSVTATLYLGDHVVTSLTWTEKTAPESFALMWSGSDLDDFESAVEDYFLYLIAKSLNRIMENG